MRHSERREETEVCGWCVGKDFRFFTPLRCVQNDRVRGAALRMTVCRVAAFSRMQNEH